MSLENTNVAILGGGFIGGNLAMYLAEKGYHVNVIDRGHQPNETKHKCITWVNASIEHQQYLTQVIRGCGTVFHLFSSTVPGDKVSLEQEISNNIYLLSSILDICAVEQVSRFIFMSSASVYGLQGEIPISEKVAPLPISTHGLQKLAMENLIHIKTRNSSLKSQILRLANPYGPGQNLMGRQGFIAIALGKVKVGQPVIVRGTGDAVRDFIHIDDVMKVCLQVMNKPATEFIFNVGLGRGVTLIEVLKELGRVLNKEIQVEYTLDRDEDIPVSILDISKAKNHLGFVPYINLREGLEALVSYHKLKP